MLIRLSSDNHFEHRVKRSDPATKLFKTIDRHIPPDDRDSESTLVLAGDISPYFGQRVLILEHLLPRFRRIIYIAGNHEFYGGELTDWGFEANRIAERLPENIHLSRTYQAQNKEFDGVNFIYSTMWTEFGEGRPLEEMTIANMPDCRAISYLGKRLKPEYIWPIHKANLESTKSFLETCYAQNPAIPRVVITHHMPAMSLCDPRYGNSPANGLFASRDTEPLLAADYAPQFWLYGHTHAPNKRKLENTVCICNPKGYPKELGCNYEPRMFIEV